MRTPLTLLLVAAAPALASADATRSKKTAIKVTSTAFSSGGMLPAQFTCEGAQTTPPLAWTNVPPGTQSIAILVDDPDAPGGTFTHWLITGLRPDAKELIAGGALPDGAVPGKNSNGESGYTPPCPPSGKHRYVFHVFAFDRVVALAGSKADFLAASAGHLLADGQLVATYQKGGKS
jgi:Raf kinase inhibitor-like YbhB/YbcL family protein